MVLYSNAYTALPLETTVASWELINTEDDVCEYAFDYKFRFEQTKGGLRIIRGFDSVIIEQFRLLALFSFRAYFSTQRDQVAKTCIPADDSPNRAHSSSYVRHYFTPRVEITLEQAKDFCKFVEKVLGMPRKAYEKVIDCLRCFANDIELVGYNTDLAYSMLVYCAEALSQEFDDFKPKWDNLHGDTRKPMDVILEQIDPQAADGIRTILLEQQHFKLTERFISFVTAHLPDSFFVEDASDSVNPIRPSDLRKMLENVYGARSKFVHTLKSIRHQVKVPQIADGEVFRTTGEPYLTWAYRQLYAGKVQAITQLGRTMIPKSEVDRLLKEAGRYLGAKAKVRKEDIPNPKEAKEMASGGAKNWSKAATQRKKRGSQQQENAHSANGRKPSSQELPHPCDPATSRQSVYRRLTQYKSSRKSDEGRGA